MYDVIIIGGGPAGMSAGIYTSRARLKTLLIDNYSIDAQIVMANKIENFPGFHDGISGVELLEKLTSQAKNFGIEIVSGEVTDITKVGVEFDIKMEANSYKTLALIIATGGKPRMLGVPGENELKGSGVSYCAICDGVFFRDKKVIVVGGGNTAVGDAIFLTRFCTKVWVVHRRNELRASKILQERALSTDKIEFLMNSKILEIGGNQKVENVLIENVITKEKSIIDCDGVFVFIGHLPNTGFLKDILAEDEIGYIITDDEMKTSKEGIFACGDCRKKLLRQAITASSDGAIAAYSAEKYI